MLKDKKWLILIFLIGFAILIYPLISRVYYNYRGNEEIDSFQQGIEQMTDAETTEKLNLAYAYNSALLSNDMVPLSDPYSEDDKVEGVAEYARMIEVNEKIGVINIPDISVSLPIYAGTNENVLQKGAGHLEGTSLPIGGLNTNSVITAHRGLPDNKLFTDLDKMERGDLFFVETVAGEMAYEVVEIKVIEPHEISELAIEENRDLVTLLTCTPYMVNSHRLLVIGERTEMPTEEIEEAAEVSIWNQLLNLISDYKWHLLIVAVIILVMYFSKNLRNRAK